MAEQQCAGVKWDIDNIGVLCKQIADDESAVMGVAPIVAECGMELSEPQSMHHLEFNALRRWTDARDYEPYAHDQCCHCGQPLNPLLAKWLRMYRPDRGEWLLVAPGYVPEQSQFGGLFALPVGRKCLRQHPEWHFAVIDAHGNNDECPCCGTTEIVRVTPALPGPDGWGWRCKKCEFCWTWS